MYSYKSTQVNSSHIAQHLEKLGLLLNKCTDLIIDSRSIQLGSIFCAYPGTTTDGRNYIDHACLNGAKAIFYEPDLDLDIPIENYSITNLMHYVGILAAYKYNYPASSSYNIAVTGTNGKTTITHWLNQAYSFLKKKTAIVGTTGIGIYPDIEDSMVTTPDPITLQHLFAKFRDHQVDIAAMEVSSHALEQGRINGINFNIAIFTNLTQDHLDYHHTMENYYLAKEKLFYWNMLEHAIINCDDPYGQRLINKLSIDRPSLNIISYGINNGTLQARNIKLNNKGLSFLLNYQGHEQLIKANIIGYFNIYNILAVISSLIISKVEWENIPTIIQNLQAVIGRMETISQLNKPLVVIDYAHTPDALEKALQSLNQIKSAGRLICVFGCGGNRDQLKRPLMAKVATELANEVIITTDNPRFEDPKKIIEDIIVGSVRDNWQIVEDRKMAIIDVLKNAGSNDIILIAGKGHETYQEIQGTKHHFSDAEIVKEYI